MLAALVDIGLKRRVHRTSRRTCRRWSRVLCRNCV